jgi:outer membrane protein OmpA-like peptidoglycan-associated protein
MEALLTTNKVNGTVTMSSNGLDIKVGSPTTQSSEKALDVSGIPNLVNGGFLESSCNGFLPGAELTYFLVNTKMAMSLGKLPVSRIGTCSGLVQLPKSLTQGAYTLQIEGLVSGNRLRTATTQVLSASIQVNVVKSAGKYVATPTSKQDARKQRIQFEPYSAKLTKAAKEQLRVMVEQLPNKTGNFVRIVGFVSAGGSASHASELGNTRSKSVQRYLTSRGVRGTYVLMLGGNTVKNTQQAPHARVTIYPNQ